MDDEQLAAQSVTDEFRQALADTQFLLAKANALVKIRDRRIAELTEKVAALEARKPQGSPGDHRPTPLSHQRA